MKKYFHSQIFILAVIVAILGSFNISAQEVSKSKDKTFPSTSLGYTTDAINVSPDLDCTGLNQLIYDDNGFENGYGWNNTVTDGRMVSSESWAAVTILIYATGLHL